MNLLESFNHIAYYSVCFWEVRIQNVNIQIIENGHSCDLLQLAEKSVAS